MAEQTREELYSEYVALKKFRDYFKATASKQAQDWGYIIHENRIKYCPNIGALEIMIKDVEKRLGITETILKKQSPFF